MTDIINDLFGFMSSSENSSYQKYMTKLKQQQLALDTTQSYNSALDTLIQMGDTYQDIGYQISQINADISSAQYYLDERYQADYDYQMLQAQANVDKFANYFDTYDQNRALTMNSMFYNNIGNLQALQQNLANQQVIAAERGQTGSTARLLNAIQKQSIVNFAGADQTLDADGGLYGQQYQAQANALDTEYSENETAYNLAVMGRDELQKDLEQQYQNIVGKLDIAEQARSALLNTQKLYYDSFEDALASTIKAGHYAGETYSDLGKKVDEYRQYLSVSDAEYAQMKANLLNEWKPIDFEIRTKTYTWETGGEGENGANEHSVDYYQIYDKATGKLATQEQVENMLRTYAGNLKESDWYGGKFKWGRGGGARNSYGLSDKAIETIMKNSNYKKRKDYT